MKKMFSAIVVVFMFSAAMSVSAQTTEFTYQGRLLDNALPATANYDFEFSLWDSLVAGTQAGTTQTVTGVAVANGIFTVKLNFGAQFSGPARFIEIHVRPTGGGAYTTLAPRQPITSAPHAIRSATAGNADNATNATTANNALNLGGVAANQYVVTTDPRMINARDPLPNSQNYIQNSTTQQASSNFNISGNGVVGGNFGVGTTNPIYKVQTQIEEDNYSYVHTDGTRTLGTYTNSAENSGMIGTITEHPFQIFTSNSGPVATFTAGGSASGNVGIGTTAPTERLDVQGNVKFSGTITGNGSGLSNVTARTTTNMALLGSLRWDVLRAQNNFAVGTRPSGIAFDGANVWVANYDSNNVTKLRASDGALQGTFAVGSGPYAVAFDGANIWVGNNVSNTVTKLRASDGALQGTFTVGIVPVAVAFDGANIWVANNGNNTVTKLRASDGALQGTFAVGGIVPLAVAFDGANIWVTHSSNVTKLRASDGALQGTFAVGAGPSGIAFDGANIWVTNLFSNNVTKLRASDGALQGTFAVGGSGPRGVAFDGANIWVANSGSNTVTKLRASDGALLGAFPVGNEPYGGAFDGVNIWVVNRGSNNVTRLPVFP